MVHIGIVGCGYWGINYVRVFNEIPGSTVVRICDIDENRLQIAHRRFPFVFPTRQLEELLSDNNIDAVVVATPAATHYDIAKTCLNHDLHVLVEKPLSTRIDESQELIDLAEERECRLMVGHTFLYNTGIHKVKEYLSSEDFGSIYYLHATRTHLGLIRDDVDAIWDLAPHDISIFSFLLGSEPLWVSAVGSGFLNSYRPDVGFITMGYSQGIIANIHVSWISSNKVREIVVVGSRKRIVFDDLSNLEPVRVFEKGAAITGDSANFGEFKLQLRDGDILSPHIEGSEPLKNQCTRFLEWITEDERPVTDGYVGLEVVRVMEAIDESIKKRGAPVDIVR